MQIELITLAITNMPEMIAFYNNVFDAGLMPVGNSPFYRGTFAGVDLLFCPNDIAGVEAKQNRHQFRVSVADLEAFSARLIAAGGEVLNEGSSGERKILGVRDIDGNTYELIQAK